MPGLLDNYQPQGGLLGGDEYTQPQSLFGGLVQQYVDWQRNRDHAAELSRLFSDPQTALGFAGVTRMPRVWLGEGASPSTAANASFGRPMPFPDSTPTSAANVPVVVFDTRAPSGHLGTFDSTEAAMRFMSGHPDGRWLDYGTPGLLTPK